MASLEIVRLAWAHKASALYVILTIIFLAGFVAGNRAATVVGGVGAAWVWVWCEVRSHAG